ncbi:MAG: 4-hydroxyphenylpyruvate dioxygenase [Burkholderiaceae bacterium]|nr:4-hydroxyphenylpyruvate dioxygenase [Burkholderiaceae bacterium]
MEAARNEDREELPVPGNPLGLEGIEFVEYRCLRPQALGRVLEMMGFRPVARHRSREVLLYRQGPMNVVIDAHRYAGDVPEAAAPVISGLALRVRDAAAAFERCVAHGAWPVASHARPMELLIPAIQGPAGARFYFVDRWRDFSIFDVDFTPIPTVEQHPPALAGMHWFGIVHYAGLGRVAHWIAFLQEMLGLQPIADEVRFGILPKGTLLRSPCNRFYWQLIEPEPDAVEADPQESLPRVGIGTPDVLAAVAALRARGVEFVTGERLAPQPRGALTVPQLGSVCFELVHSPATDDDTP